jgi:hypothetical protein
MAVLLVLGVSACGQAKDPAVKQQPMQAVPQSMPTGTMPTGKPAASNAAIIAVPEDKQQLQRLLAMGYTVHEDHMHPPGMKECPFNMGGGVVQ